MKRTNGRSGVPAPSKRPSDAGGDRCRLTTVLSAIKATRVATGLFVLLLGLVSLVPVATTGSGGQQQDTWISPITQNVLHVPTYTVLSVLAVGCLSVPGRSRWSRVLPVAAACVGYGALLELAQAFIPGRLSSVPDAMLNTLGVMLGLAITRAWGKSPTTDVSVVAVDAESPKGVGDESSAS